MRVVLLGASGMLGQALMEEGQARSHEMIGDRVEITDDAALAAHFEKHQPDIVINSAALTDLKRCEQNPYYADAVNAYAVGSIMKISGFRFVQISSDQCQGALLNKYARSKRHGEWLATNQSPDSKALIVRTNIVGLKNMAWAFDAIENDSPITLFDDYFTSSIDIWSFSRVLFDVLEKHPEECGILNIGSRDTRSKKDFIEALGKAMGRTLTQATTGSVKDLTPERSTDCGLDVSRIESLLGRRMPDLNEVINALVERRNQPCINPLPLTTG